MTVRSVLLGLLGVCILCTFTYINDGILHQTFVVGNNMPIAVYGALLVVVLFNPLLFRIWKRLALTGAEIAVIITMVLAVCCIPESGLMRHFTVALAVPFHYVRTTPAWQDSHILEKVPPAMVPEINPGNANKVLYGLIKGLGTAKTHIAVRDVPWSAWWRPLAFWIPLNLILLIGLLALSVVVHNQWARHEQLPYPIAAFANSLLPEGKRVLSGLFSNRLFWYGMIPVLVIHLNNFATLWFPNLVPIQLRMSLFPWQEFFFFPTLLRAGGAGWATMVPSIIFTVVAIAYFLPAEISLALGIGPICWYLLVGWLMGYGIKLNSGESNPSNFMAFGAYFGALLVLLYTGRKYYSDIFRAAFGMKVDDPPGKAIVFSARLFMVAVVAFVWYLSALGQLDWPIAVMYTGCLVMMYLVMGRIIAETGVFFLSPDFYPSAIILSTLGAVALGPKSFLLLSVLSVILLTGVREAFMPFMVNSLKLLDLQNVAPSKILVPAMLALIVGLAVAVPVTMYFQYDRGANAADTWLMNTPPRTPFDSTVLFEQTLAGQDRLAEANSITGIQHILHMAPRSKAIIAFFVGIALMLLFTAGRLRFVKWPIHPVIFLTWSAWPSTWFWASFMLGWLLKVLVTKYGGGKIYQQLKPLVFGLVAGEVTAGLLTMIIGCIYYLVTGQPPKPFSIMVG